MPDNEHQPDCPHHGEINAEIRNLKASDARQWDVLERVQNRLPVWATTWIGVLMAIAGALGTALLT
ncbi:hypothetical protein STSP2_03160 [Anaerohalosphaera lusitana]|uniref:Uncharacterized protein n=1 Tax=Anaerohalosphaera lusitana TaxID=1936003 RepID=A0A1U9NQR4_9BACT|nr:hypothetical protein [Anaerohalosphaera lusitana]AQT69960.1 hypothetical protein STSP2_03160 [Anaerohalosphaera lusitana]